MYWKKSEKDENIIPARPNDFRTSYRVAPHVDCPVELAIEGTVVDVVNIGAGGVAFRNAGFEAGASMSSVIRLHGCYRAILTCTYIISVDRHDICHCSFSGITEEDIDAIHKYILSVQKSEIRERNMRRSA